MANKTGVKMVLIAVARGLKKVTAPIVSATKLNLAYDWPDRCRVDRRRGQAVCRRWSLVNASQELYKGASGNDDMGSIPSKCLETRLKTSILKCVLL
ncbi:hypothetical protein BDM02DRAFT_3122906, partial [Thelephora ganbajun]